MSESVAAVTDRVDSPVTRRALVTGGAGFIGSHLCEALAARGWEVVSLDDFSGGARPGEGRVGGVETVTMDITDPGLGRAVADIRPDVVFHLAAVSSVTLGREDPKRCREVNRDGTARVLESAAQSGAAQLVNVSSLAVHASSSSGDANVYGGSKQTAEELVNRQAPAVGIGWINLRPANVYGPGQGGDGESAVVATWLEAIRNDQPLFLDGDGRQTRDFLYVGDAVEALIRAADRTDGQTLELGVGREISLLELLDSMKEVTGWKGSPQPRPAREGDIRRSVTDPRPACDALGWRAVTDLTTGLRKTWDRF